MTRLSRVSPLAAPASARMRIVAGGAMAASFDNEADPKRLALVDLSPLPRFGLKGADAESILRASGFDAPAFGRAALQPGGETAAGLGGGEFLILCAPDGGLAAQKTVAAAVAARAKKSQVEAMTLPRRDSHGWFALCGEERFAAAARLCAIDLRAGEVFLTRFAAVDAIVIADARAPVLHLLFAASLAEFMRAAIVDSADVGMAGFDSFRALFARGGATAR